MAGQQDQREILVALYQEYREHARHIESITESANNFMLAIGTAIIAIITADDKLGVTCPARQYLSIGLSCLGLLGTIFSISYTMRYYRNTFRGEKIIDKLDEVFFVDKKKDSGTTNPDNNNTSITILRNEADVKLWLKKEKEKKYKSTIVKWLFDYFLNTHSVWILFAFFVFLLGIYLRFNLPGEC